MGRYGRKGLGDGVQPLIPTKVQTRKLMWTLKCGFQGP